MQRCSGHRQCLQEETASLPCPHQGPGVCSYRGRKAAIPSHGRTAGRNLVPRAGPAGGHPEISASSLGSWRGQRPPHEEPSPCRGGPRLLGLWGLKVFAGQQRVNPTLFHFLPGGVAVTPPGLVTRHCESMNSRDEKPSERGAGMGTTQLSSLGLPTRSRSLSSPTNWGDGRPSRRKGLEQVAGLHLAGAAATIVFNWGGRESN